MNKHVPPPPGSPFQLDIGEHDKIEPKKLASLYIGFQFSFWTSTALFFLGSGTAFGWIAPENTYHFINHYLHYPIYSALCDLLISHFLLHQASNRLLAPNASVIKRTLVLIILINLAVVLSCLADELFSALIWNRHISFAGLMYNMMVTIKYITFSIWPLFFGALTFYVQRRYDEQKRRQLDVSLRESQLNELKQQLNPQFIFSTLTALRELIEINQDLARDTVSGLANLLRYSLYESENDTASLEREVEIVKDYLALNAAQNGHHVKTQWDIPRELLHHRIIPLSLLVLVENALNVNQGGASEERTMNIHGAVEGHDVVISVENNGQMSEVTSTGIENTRKRLALIFGDQASLSLQQKALDKVLAKITMPVSGLA